MCSNHDDDGDKNHLQAIGVVAFMFLIVISMMGWNSVANYQRMVKDCETAAQSQCEIVAVPSEDLR